MKTEVKSLSSTIINALRVKGFTVEKLAQTTGVSDRFLESLVEEKFENLPPSPYVHGYLVKIAGALGLDGESLWQEYLKDNDVIKRSGKSDQLPRNRFVTSRLRGKAILVGLVILGFIVYVVLRTPLFLNQPGLELMNLSNDTTFTEDANFSILGKVSSAYKLTLNGERVYPDDDGNFEKTIPLQEGFNTLVFSVKKFLGKERLITKQVFYQVNEENFLQNGQ
ncbi:MAG: helix-turn-helix domain-containing protein [Patescibacteria group bacterium]|nr:helix-turn-helix domain-containing protein [Patescibacteria group bacterium]